MNTQRLLALMACVICFFVVTSEECGAQHIDERPRSDAPETRADREARERRERQAGSAGNSAMESEMEAFANEMFAKNGVRGGSEILVVNRRFLHGVIRQAQLKAFLNSSPSYLRVAVVRYIYQVLLHSFLPEEQVISQRERGDDPPTQDRLSSTECAARSQECLKQALASGSNVYQALYSSHSPEGQIARPEEHHGEEHAHGHTTSSRCEGSSDEDCYKQTLALELNCVIENASRVDVEKKRAWSATLSKRVQDIERDVEGENRKKLFAEFVSSAGSLACP